MYRKCQVGNGGELNHTQGPSEYSHRGHEARPRKPEVPEDTWLSWGHTATAGAEVQAYNVLWLPGGECSRVGSGPQGSSLMITHTSCGEEAPKPQEDQKFKNILSCSESMSLAWATWPRCKRRKVACFFFFLHWLTGSCWWQARTSGPQSLSSLVARSSIWFHYEQWETPLFLINWFECFQRIKLAHRCSLSRGDQSHSALCDNSA